MDRSIAEEERGVMTFSLQELNEEERTALIVFCDRYPAIVENTSNLIRLFATLVQECPDNWWYFKMGYQGCARFLSLAQLSAGRGHWLEAMHNLRLVLEASLTTCYVANFPETQPDKPAFGNELVTRDKNMKEEAIIWLKAKLPTCNERLYIQKKYINETTAHSGLAALALELLTTPPDDFGGRQAWLVGNTAGALVDMFLKTLLGVPGVILAPGAGEVLHNLYTTNLQLKVGLKLHI
ncbi:MAG: hypothetical protein HQ559_10130 [Lentisphaerae bacterium]|nr:hypothetical protein [Lentisphaerota bacterium]